MLAVLEKKIGEISRQVKVAFTSAMIFGLLAHYFAIASKITNHDDIRETVCDQNQLAFGRWFKAVASDVSGDLSMTYNCLLGLVYVSLAAILVVRLLCIRSCVIAGLVGALMTTFPSITFNNLYQGTADVYALDILLTVIGAYVAVREKKRVVSVAVPVILLTLGLGIYQAYLGLAFGLFIIVGIMELVYEKCEFKKVFWDEIRYLVTGGLSLLAYMIVQKIVSYVTGVTLDEYQSIDKMGTEFFVMFPYRLRLAVVKSLGFFLKNVKSVHYSWLTFGLIAIVVFSLVVFIIQIIKSEIKKMELVLCIALLICFPIASGFIYLEGADHVHLLILYGIIVFPLFLLLMIDRVEYTFITENNGFIKVLGKYYQGFGIIVFVLLVYNYITLANTIYTIDYYVYEESYSQAQTLLTNIRNTPGYTENSTIYRIGQYQASIDAIPEFLAADSRTKEFIDLGLDRNFNYVYSRNSFYWYYLGFTNTIKDIDMQDAKEMGINDIDVYPNKKGIVELDGDIVIRFE